jgi:hypothetical protein
MIGEEKLPAMSLVRMCEPLLRVAEIKTKGAKQWRITSRGKLKMTGGVANLCRW